MSLNLHLPGALLGLKHCLVITLFLADAFSPDAFFILQSLCFEISSVIFWVSWLSSPCGGSSLGVSLDLANLDGFLKQECAQ